MLADMIEKKNSSLRQRILADLQSTAPTSLIDPEHAEIDSNTSAKLFEHLDGDDTAAADDPETDVAEIKEQFGTLRKRSAAIVLDDGAGKYSGERTSRKSLTSWNGEQLHTEDDEHQADDDDDDEDVDEEDDEEEKQGGDVDLAVEEDDIDENEAVQSDESSNYGDDYDDDNRGESDDDDDVDDDDEDGDDNIADDDDNTEMVIDPSKLPSDLQESFPSEQPDNELKHDEPSNFNPATSDETSKADATRSQLTVWDKLLENRIRLQKCLTTSNVLPREEHREMFRAAGGSGTVDLSSAAQTSISNLLTKLLELQTVLLDGNTETRHVLTGAKAKMKDEDEEIASDTDEEEKEKEEGDDVTNKLELPSKRKHTLTVGEYEDELSKRHKAIETYRNDSITKWYEKTRLMTGKLAGGKFTSFDRSPLTQIQQVLQDRDRLVARTQLKRTPFRILGTPESLNETEPEGTDGNATTGDEHLKDQDENVFDDGDFYHELLKELIESKSGVDASDSLAVSRQWLQLQKLRAKAKRKVDTRASKGRKVRYAVHPKLVNFMTVQPAVSGMGDRARNDLFASAFGRSAVVDVDSNEDLRIF